MTRAALLLLLLAAPASAQMNRLRMEVPGAFGADSLAHPLIVHVERADTAIAKPEPEHNMAWVSPFNIVPRLRFYTVDGGVWLIEERPGARPIRISSLWRW